MLAQWQCHKIVKAGKIVGMPIDRSAFNGQVVLQVENTAGGSDDITCTAGMFARGTPKLGDYIVLYDDGYWSWSPAATFEAGYTRV